MGNVITRCTQCLWLDGVWRTWTPCPASPTCVSACVRSAPAGTHVVLVRPWIKTVVETRLSGERERVSESEGGSGRARGARGWDFGEWQSISQQPPQQPMSRSKWFLDECNRMSKMFMEGRRSLKSENPFKPVTCRYKLFWRSTILR